jgi:hypothetical protein
MRNHGRILVRGLQPAGRTWSPLECPRHKVAESGCLFDGGFVSLLDACSETCLGVVRRRKRDDSTHHIWTLLADMSRIFANATRSSVEGKAVLV